jgi:transcriptional regulator with XRE-family HTH domain
MAAGVLTVPRWFLGEALKRLRTESGKTIDELAEAIGKSRARLINVLDGRGTLAADELAKLLDVLGADGQQTIELLALGCKARRRPSPRPYTDLLPHAFERLPDLEAIATEIYCYERGVVPGLLQTPEYIEAIVADAEGIWWEPSFHERNKRIMFRLARQKMIMEDQRKVLRFVVSEDALLTVVGGTDTMVAQLEYIRSLVDRPNIHLRILAPTVAHNPSPSAGLELLRLGADQRLVGMLPVLYGPSTYIDDPIATSRLSCAFSRIEDLAMSADASREHIAGLVERTRLA